MKFVQPLGEIRREVKHQIVLIVLHALADRRVKRIFVAAVKKIGGRLSIDIEQLGEVSSGQFL